MRAPDDRDLRADAPGIHTEDVPTGNDTDTANDYFAWLYGEYIERSRNAFGGPPATWEGVWWTGPFLQLFATAAVLIVFFAVFARYLNETHRPRAAYKLSRYDRVTERHGRFGPFSVVVTAGIVGWALYYPISHVVRGQVY